MGRPLTQRELKKREKSKAEESRITVVNAMKNRSITIQLRDGNSDFYIGERSVYVRPGKSFTERASLFNDSQLSNLKAKGEIRVLTTNI